MVVMVINMFTGDFRDPEARLKWQSVDNPVFELDEGSLLVRITVLIFQLR